MLQSGFCPLKGRFLVLDGLLELRPALLEVRFDLGRLDDTHRLAASRRMLRDGELVPLVLLSHVVERADAETLLLVVHLRDDCGAIPAADAGEAVVPEHLVDLDVLGQKRTLDDDGLARDFVLNGEAHLLSPNI